MKKLYGVASLLVFCIALLTGCGDTSYASMSHTDTSRNQANKSTAKVVQVHITLSDFYITSSLMTFQRGVPYHFTVINKGIVDHELMLMSTAMKTMNMSGMSMKDMDQMALVSLESIKPGGTNNFDYAFAFSTTGPHPELSCHLRKHYENGMHLDLTVR